MGNGWKSAEKLLVCSTSRYSSLWTHLRLLGKLCRVIRSLSSLTTTPNLLDAFVEDKDNVFIPLEGISLGQNLRIITMLIRHFTTLSECCKETSDCEYVDCTHQYVPTSAVLEI